MFSSGPAETEGRHFFLASTGWLFWNLKENSLLAEGNSKSPPHWVLTAMRIAFKKRMKPP
jgi:hypothetical protein